MAAWKGRGIAVVQYLIVYFLISLVVVQPLRLVLDASPEGTTALTLLALVVAIPATRAVRRWRRSEAA